MQNDRIYIALTALAACGIHPLTATAKTAGAGGQKPNVIIIYADDVGFGDLSCNGSKTISTPNVDRLAKAGIRFTNAHTTSSTSTPARFGLLTGRYPWRVKGTDIATGDAGMIIAPGTCTIASLMQQAGYKTAAVGKWHLGLGETARQDWNGEITPGLKETGFDHSFIMAATGDRVPCVYIENQRVYNYDPSAPIYVSYKQNFPGEPTGKSNPELLTKLRPSHGHDQSIVNGISRIGYMKGGGKALWRDEDIADVITGKAVEFIEANATRPFFLYLGTNDIHVPRVPHERFVGKSGMGARGDAILSFDFTVGRLMETLGKLGIMDNTIIVLSSDNGPVLDDGYRDRAVELLGAHRPWWIYRGGKYSAFEAGTRTPLIIKWNKARGVKAGQVSDALVSHIDMMATLAQVEGVTLPAGAAPDSRNALAALEGKDKLGREWVVEQNVSTTLSLLAADGYKYIEPSKGPALNKNSNIEMGNNPNPQLYNTKADPGETNNLAATMPAKVDQLASLLGKIVGDGGFRQSNGQFEK
ncbi:arylsulfatase [Bacteroidia bacterium]|nr:arylsulfatase [Bacteroidia bacterium]